MADALLRQVLEALPSAALLVDEGRRILFANQAVERLCGATREALVSQPITSLLHEEQGTLATVWLSRHLSPEERALLRQPLPVRIIRNSAAELEADLSVTVLTAESGEVVFLLVLQESRFDAALLRQLTLTSCFRSAVAPAMQANSSAAGQFNTAAMLRLVTTEFGATLVRLWLIEPQKSFWRLHKSVSARNESWQETPRQFEEAALPPEIREAAILGRPYFANGLQEHPAFNPDWLAVQGVDSVAAYPLFDREELRGVLAVFGARPFRDETQEGLAVFSAVASLLLSARAIDDCGWHPQEQEGPHLERVGALAGGVAHEFNNMLAVILGQSELLLQRLEAGDPTRQAIESIQRAGERTAEMTRQLLAFGRRQFLEPRLTDLSAFVSRLKPEILELSGPSIRVVVVPDANPETVLIDPQRLREAVLTLVQRACAAMPNGGTLTLTVRNLGPREVPRGLPTAVPHLTLAIADTGAALDAEGKARLFEPFYVAGAAAGQVGLDMAAVHGFVGQSGGCIGVESEPGRGTVIQIYLPRAPVTEIPARGLSQSLTSHNGH